MRLSTLNDFCLHFSGTEWPRCLAMELIANECRLSLYIDEHVRWFEGHFPQQPVLAGVVQTHWAAEIAKAVFPLGENFIRIDNLKFQSVIVPSKALSLVLEYFPEKNSVKFRYVDDALTFSEGKLVFSPATGEA